MLFADIDANGWVMIIGAVGIILVQIAQMFLNHFRAKETARKVEEVASKVDKAQEVLGVTTHNTEVKLEEISSVTKSNHTLLNSNMGAALKLTAELSRWKADQTNNPLHVKEAEMAEKNYHEHEIKQSQVDAKDAKEGKQLSGPVSLMARIANVSKQVADVKEVVDDVKEAMPPTKKP